jgi:hypothetical protein
MSTAPGDTEVQGAGADPAVEGILERDGELAALEVEGHLSNTHRKLDISGRRELPTALAA